MFKYTKHFSTKATPQGQPIPGAGQIPNSAGGYAWGLDDWDRLDRFLVLGSDGGTYYVGEHELTVDTAQVVARCIDADGIKTIARIVAASSSGVETRDGTVILSIRLAARLDG